MSKLSEQHIWRWDDHPDRYGYFCTKCDIERQSIIPDCQSTEEIVMYFHGFGQTSEEIRAVLSTTKKHVILDNGYMFDRASGECVNDNTDFGCFRTINPST